MLKFSLILATLDRDKEVEMFLESLEKQTYNNYELIIVDQNTDNRVQILYNKFKKNIDIKYIRTTKKGLSRARNLGLKYVNGNVIAFPDDDCEYPENLLNEVNKKLNENSEISVITGKSIDKESKLDSNGSWPLTNKMITLNNAIKTAISYTIFIKPKDIIDICFDEKLGVGEYFSSGEESDLVLNLLHKGYKALYNPSIYVYHPIKPENENRVYNYALGLGALIKKEFINRKNYLYMNKFLEYIICKPIIGMVINVIRFNKRGVNIYYRKLKGRTKGFIEY